jgi:ABC-type multidrug transport system fused ATPase/permease subunit
VPYLSGWGDTRVTSGRLILTHTTVANSGLSAFFSSRCVSCPRYAYAGLVSFAQSDLRLLQIVIALRAVQQPSSIPVSLASLHLMQTASSVFMEHVRMLLQETGSFSDRLTALRKLFEAVNISNKVTDGTTPFPENEQSLRHGISLEFRYLVCRLRIVREVNVMLSPGVCHFDIPAARGTLCVRFPLQLGRANFAYVHSCHDFGSTKCSRPLPITGHPWFQRIREKHDSKASGSSI